MLKSFSVQNYRNLDIDKMEYKKINILIGPNNSGKSNLVQSISFFPDLIGSNTKGSAFHEEVRKRGWDEVLRRDIQDAGIVSLKWVINTNVKLDDLTYELAFRVTKDAPYPEGVEITHEELRYNNALQGKPEPFQFLSCHNQMAGKGKFSIQRIEDGKKSRVTLAVKNTESVFRQMKTLLESEEFRRDFYPVFIRTVESVEEFFDRFRTYSSTGFALDKIRHAQIKDIETVLLDSRGTNFVNVLANLDKKHQFIDRFTQRMQIVIPQLQSLKIEVDSDDKRFLQVEYGGKTFKLSELSDGTLKAFLLGLLLWSPEKLEVLTLDEPELNLHPAWLRAFAHWIQATQSVNQVFLSTHSPDLLDHFTDGFRKQDVALFVCNTDGDSSVQQVDPSRLEAFFDGGYQLGDLYRVGEPRLGGWPL